MVKSNFELSGTLRMRFLESAKVLGKLTIIQALLIFQNLEVLANWKILNL